MVINVFDDHRDFESVKRKCRLKLDLTFLIRRLRNRGKNRFEALGEMNRYAHLDFSNFVPMMSEKQHCVVEIQSYYRDLCFYNRDYPGSDRWINRWIFLTMTTAGDFPEMSGNLLVCRKVSGNSYDRKSAGYLPLVSFLLRLVSTRVAGIDRKLIFQLVAVRKL